MHTVNRKRSRKSKIQESDLNNQSDQVDVNFYVDEHITNKIEEISIKISDALTTKFIELPIEKISKGFYVYIENVMDPLSTDELLNWKSSLPKNGWTGIQKIYGNSKYRKGNYRFQIAPGEKSFPHYTGLKLIELALKKLFVGKDDRITLYYLKSIEGKFIVKI